MRTLLGSVLVMFIAASAAAEQRPVIFYWENDSFRSAWGGGTDNDYTNGLRLMVGGAKQRKWSNAVETFHCTRLKLCRTMPTIDRSISYGFTHQFYTPRRITVARPQPLDRPWAGYMYASAMLQLTDGENEQHVFEGQLGILGQGAGAQYVQTRWHQFIGSPNDPAGWHNQVKNEPVANLLYTYNYLHRIGKGNHADVMVSPGFMLGTLQTYPAVGATVRLGRNISGFSFLQLPAARGNDDGEPRPRWEGYFMGGADARYVVHNATLDGGFFNNDGPSVDREPLVHDLRAGFSVRRDSLRLSYNFVTRGREFATPPGGPSTHRFHSLALSWEPAR